MPDTGAAPRAAAARAVVAAQAGRSLDAALQSVRADLNPADGALAAAIAFGVLRDYRLLAALVDPLLRRPPAPPVHALLLVGLQQLRSMRVPAHAAVHATVAAAELLGRRRAGGLINAVLRRYQRERDALEAALPDRPALRYSHPDWLVKSLRADWPAAWQSILAANNQPPPMTLRVNARQASRDQYQRRLAAAGIEAETHAHAPHALILRQPCAVDDLPGFADGAVSVQDVAAQLAAPLLQTQPGMRVLDACAAPGGKAAHCLETVDCALLALDIDEARITAVAETFDRLGLQGGSRCADASRPQDWWDGHAYQRILIDAPCTGTGVIRRHPDIKWLRREADPAAMAQRQRALLDALWPLLAPDGLLLYATCSTLRAESADVVGSFLTAMPDAVEAAIDAAWGQAETVGRRIAPGADGMDGFYYARLGKG